MKKKEQKNVIYKGTHQDFSIKRDGSKKDIKPAQKVFLSAILPTLLALTIFVAIFSSCAIAR